MKFNFKRFLAFVLALVMVFSYVPAGAFATGEATEDDSVPAKPTVNVTEDENENANFGVKFKADVLSDAQEKYYGTWNVDVVITLNRDATMTNNFQNKGQFCPTLKCVELLENSNWTVFEGSHAESEVLKAGTPWSLLGYIRGFEGMSDMALPMSGFAALSDGLSVGADLNPDYLAANPGLKATVELVLTNPETNETVVIAEHQYESPVKAPELPAASVSKIYMENLTFGMNFQAAEVSEEQMKYYGDWYADFELTVNKKVVFGADSETSDGWLSGRYAAWENGSWVNVPFDTEVTVEANEPLRIMKLASEILDKPDLKMTFKEIQQEVQDFDCGVFFTEEFLKENSDVEVKLELRLYNPALETESYTVGTTHTFTVADIKPALPTATIKEILTDNLTFAMNFKVNEVTDEQLTYYGEWYADFELTANKDVVLNANEDVERDGYLSGQYDEWSSSWVNVPFEESVTLKAGEPLKIMQTAAKQMNKEGLQIIFREVVESIKDFDCGVYFEDAFLADNSDLEVKLELRMYNPKVENESYVVGDTYIFTLDEVKPNLPTAAASELKKEDLTFAMNFKAETVTEEQLEYYDEWYADFELTVNKDVTFYTGEGADGYLSGQYDAENEWYEGQWINVPFKEPVTLKAGESVKIMETAAEQMGEPGLRYTYGEVYEVVRDFDCGVYFTPKFLLANPDLEVTLELKMYNPKPNSDESYVIGETYVFTLNDYVAMNVQTGKLYKDVSMGLEEADSNQTVILLKDASDNIVTVLEKTTFDLNGFELEAKYVACFGDIVDNSEEIKGLLKVDSSRILIQEKNAQLPVNTGAGYMFAKVVKFNEAYQEAYQEGKNRYVFEPHVEYSAHSAMLQGQIPSGVTIEVLISWSAKDGIRSQNFVYNDAMVQEVLNSYKKDTGKFGRMFTLSVNGTENLDDLMFQVVVRSETGVAFLSAGTKAEQETSGEETQTTEEHTLNTTDGNSALVPVGVLMKADVKDLTLTTTELDGSSNIFAEDNETLRSIDVHVEGLSEKNTVPIIVKLPGFAEKGLNEGNLTMYHVENGVNVAMTRVYTENEVDAHNEFWYNPATGDVVMALASFSEIALLADTENAWNGNFDYSWYTNAVMPLDGETTPVYVISNADQLAAFGAIVGGMDGQTQDSFAGKTVKLIADINLGYGGTGTYSIFYPIGYYNSTGSYEKQSIAGVESSVYSFEGIFDGNGRTISNFYQNTWDMFGDYNSGYPANSNHYDDAMGLFGYVYGGTVKNLTVNNFSSDGEFTPTGVIAAYAEGNATFENIAITNCNPRVYNTGNGGIIGIAGRTNDAVESITLNNITVDNTNKISALWGSWDVACGGLVGMYRGNADANGNHTGDTIHFENCHVTAQIDVYNDVCANYQYYDYRYAGMLIGSIRHNTKDENGRSVPNDVGVSASGCTVYYENWNDYYYCELVANSQASYTHDHQFSRLARVDSVDVTNMTVTVNGTTTAIPTSGRYNYVVVKGAEGTENATCYHFVDGAQWTHKQAGEETVDVNGDGVKETVLVENNQHIYLPFDQLYTGYGWGVSGKGVENGVSDVEGVTVHGRSEAGSVKKFNAKSQLLGDPVFASGQKIKVGDFFTAVSNLNESVQIDNTNVQVFISPVGNNSTADGIYVPNTTDWTQGTLTLSGEGKAYLCISDYKFCQTTVLEITVKKADATIEFDPNGGVLQDESDRFVYASKDGFFGLGWGSSMTKITLPDAPIAPEGYSFMGWYKEDGSEYGEAGEQKEPSGSMKLYAYWAPNLTVTFDSNDGSLNVPSKTVCYIASQDAYEQITLPEAGEKAGHTFGGWMEGEILPENNRGVAGASFTPTGNVTLIACWMPNVTVSFVSNGGSVVDPISTNYADDAYTITLPNTTREGFRFMGWFTDAELTEPAAELDANGGNAGKTYNCGGHNKTLYAKWEKLYTITRNFQDVTNYSVPDFAIEGEVVTLKVTYEGSQQKKPEIKTASGKTVSYEGGKNGGGALIGYTYTFTMPAENITITTAGGTCVTGDTLVTMSDGSKKMIQDVTEGENLLVWDFFKGEYAVVPAILVVNHGEGMNDLIKLTFSDGTVVKAINGHAFFDADLNEMVLMNAVNAKDYVGHSFVQAEGDGYTTVELVDVEVTYEMTSSYSLVSAYHYNFIVEDMFSLTNSVHPMLEGLVVGEGMKYDLAADLETYGQYTYEDFADYITYEQFVAFNGPYLKISVGKGFITFDEILSLIDSYLK